jgi:RNA polymerase sigma-70 factor (ECF subfamily)
MSPDATVELQALLDRLRHGDLAARREFLERVCDRLRRLTARILYGSFPTQTPRHELDSVVHESWLRLMQALQSTDPPTVADFFRLAAHKIRQVLLDMTEKQRRLQGREVIGLSGASHPGSRLDPRCQTNDPGRLTAWTEFHERVETLPEPERTVFAMHYYLDLPQAEIARVLDLHPRKVSYLWVAATDKLAEVLDP